MSDAIKLSDEQLRELDQIIDAVRNDEITPDDFASWAAPTNNNNGSRIGSRIVGFLTVTPQVTITFLTARSHILPDMLPSEVDAIKKEATLEKLLEIRNNAIASNRKQ